MCIRDRFILTADATRKNAVLEILDDGPGIPDAKLETVFDRFYTERPSGEGFGEHSGLGLSIARQIVDAYNGQLTAEKTDLKAGHVSGLFCQWKAKAVFSVLLL